MPLREGRVIQERLKKTRPKHDPDQARKVFVKLMLQGKVSSALRWLDGARNKISLTLNGESQSQSQSQVVFISRNYKRTLQYRHRYSN